MDELAELGVDRMAELWHIRWIDMSGLGLGLAIVRESMEAMKGSVTVTSEEGAGAAFTLTWPSSETPQA